MAKNDVDTWERYYTNEYNRRRNLENKYSETVASLSDERDRYSLLEADYDRMRTLWLADIKRNAEQHERVLFLEYNVRMLKADNEYWRRVTQSNSIPSNASIRIQELEKEVDYWRTEAQVKGTMLKTPLYTDAAKFRIHDLEKENAALEGENRDLGTRVLALTKKLTAADDLAMALKAALQYHKPQQYPVVGERIGW